MNNNLVKAIIDTGKPDSIELQFLPGHSITDHSIITYDKMNGIEFTVVSMSPDDWVICKLQNSDIFKLGIKYFHPGTVFFVKYSLAGEYSNHTSASDSDSANDSGRVEFSK